MKLTRFLFSRRFEVVVTPLSSDKLIQVLEFKSDFLRKSRIGRHSRKIDFSFISPKHTFE